MIDLMGKKKAVPQLFCATHTFCLDLQHLRGKIFTTEGMCRCYTQTDLTRVKSNCIYVRGFQTGEKNGLANLTQFTSGGNWDLYWCCFSQSPALQLGHKHSLQTKGSYAGVRQRGITSTLLHLLLPSSLAAEWAQLSIGGKVLWHWAAKSRVPAFAVSPCPLPRIHSFPNAAQSQLEMAQL